MSNIGARQRQDYQRLSVGTSIGVVRKIHPTGQNSSSLELTLIIFTLFSLISGQVNSSGNL